MLAALPVNKQEFTCTLTILFLITLFLNLFRLDKPNTMQFSVKSFSVIRSLNLDMSCVLYCSGIVFAFFRPADVHHAYCVVVVLFSNCSVRLMSVISILVVFFSEFPIQLMSIMRIVL